VNNEGGNRDRDIGEKRHERRYSQGVSRGEKRKKKEGYVFTEEREQKNEGGTCVQVCGMYANSL